MVPDDQWMARATSRNDAEGNEGLAPELGGDCLTIGSAGYLRLFSTERLKSTWRSSD
jgi:hypothetical protein